MEHTIIFFTLAVSLVLLYSYQVWQIRINRIFFTNLIKNLDDSQMKELVGNLGEDDAKWLKKHLKGNYGNMIDVDNIHFFEELK